MDRYQTTFIQKTPSANTQQYNIDNTHQNVMSNSHMPEANDNNKNHFNFPNQKNGNLEMENKNNQNFEAPMQKNEFSFSKNHDHEEIREMKQRDENINYGLEKFFGKRNETRDKISKNKHLVKHINALGGIDNTFESKFGNFRDERNSLCK